jgi:uridylate kinase
MVDPNQKLEYKRVLLKLSGESLGGEKQTGIDPDTIAKFVEEVKQVTEMGLQVGIVIGGGNIFRGLSENAARMDRVTADQMGMLSTIINSLALKDAFINAGLNAHVMTASQMVDFAEPFSKGAATNYLNAGEIVIFGGGTGNPYFTTDTAAVLRAIEIEADVILKGTRVDGVYDSDPEKDSDAVKFDKLRYIDVVQRGLKVMDSTAITLSMDNNLPIIVFNFNIINNFKRIVCGENIGTTVQR